MINLLPIYCQEHCPGSLTVEQSQKSFRPYKSCIFLSNFACCYCVMLRDVL